MNELWNVIETFLATEIRNQSDRMLQSVSYDSARVQRVRMKKAQVIPWIVGRIQWERKALAGVQLRDSLTNEDLNRVVGESIERIATAKFTAERYLNELEPAPLPSLPDAGARLAARGGEIGLSRDGRRFKLKLHRSSGITISDPPAGLRFWTRRTRQLTVDFDPKLGGYANARAEVRLGPDESTIQVRLKSPAFYEIGKTRLPQLDIDLRQLNQAELYARMQKGPAKTKASPARPAAPSKLQRPVPAPKVNPGSGSTSNPNSGSVLRPDPQMLRSVSTRASVWLVGGRALRSAAGYASGVLVRLFGFSLAGAAAAAVLFAIRHTEFAEKFDSEAFKFWKNKKPVPQAVEYSAAPSAFREVVSREKPVEVPTSAPAPQPVRAVQDQGDREIRRIEDQIRAIESEWVKMGEKQDPRLEKSRFELFLRIRQLKEQLQQLQQTEGPRAVPPAAASEPPSGARLTAIGLLIAGPASGLAAEFAAKKQALTQELGAAAGSVRFVALPAGREAERAFRANPGNAGTVLVGSDLDVVSDPDARREVVGALVDALARPVNHGTFEAVRTYFLNTVEGQASGQANLDRLARDFVAAEAALAEPAPIGLQLGAKGLYFFQDGRVVTSGASPSGETERRIAQIRLQLDRAAQSDPHASAATAAAVARVGLALEWTARLLTADPARFKRNALRAAGLFRSASARLERAAHDRFLPSDLKGSYLLVSRRSMDTPAYQIELDRFEETVRRRHRSGELTQARFDHIFVEDAAAPGDISALAQGRPHILITPAGSVTRAADREGYLLEVDRAESGPVRDVPLVAASIVSGGEPSADHIKKLGSGWFRLFPRVGPILAEWIRAAAQRKSVDTSA